MDQLLAVDTGLRTGLAMYGENGRLILYLSQLFATRPALRRGVRGILAHERSVVRVVLEGGGAIAQIWEKEAERRGIPTTVIGAECWRQALDVAQRGRGRVTPKLEADSVARLVIEWAGVARPTSLRHDAAEAILVGLWGVLDLGWLEQVPDLISS